MAESHPSPYCVVYSALVDRSSVASSIYYKAVLDLTLAAGTNNRARFCEAKRDCEVCLRNCNRCKALLRAHKAAHGC